jgi:hypothetical protein
MIDPPIDPHSNSHNATYTPLQQRNFAGLPKPALPKKSDPAYWTATPVYDGKIANDVYNHAMSTPLMITQCKLLSQSPEVQHQVREATLAKWLPPRDTTIEIHTLADDTVIITVINYFDTLPYSGFAYPYDEEDRPMATLANFISQPIIPSPGALVLPDLYETYLKTLPPDQDSNWLIVAKDLSALQSISPLINHNLKVKAIINPGLQIIAMSEDVCMELVLIHDPSIMLNMQSANGDINQSLSLTQNIPLQIGDITLYVQIHIIHNHPSQPTLQHPNGKSCLQLHQWRPDDHHLQSEPRTMCNHPNCTLRAALPTNQTNWQLIADSEDPPFIRSKYHLITMPCLSLPSFVLPLIR